MVPIIRSTNTDWRFISSSPFMTSEPSDRVTATEPFLFNCGITELYAHSVQNLKRAYYICFGSTPIVNIFGIHS